MRRTRSRECDHRPERRGSRLLFCVAVACLAAIFLTGGGCGGGQARAPGKRRVIVLGFDGMDYTVVREMMAEGRLPNLARLARTGTFSPLATAMPPQSPVAWSTFITGMDAGGHGIFDFIHRDPGTMIPYLSTSRVADAGSHLRIGGYKFPVRSARIELLRHGTPFWEVLERHGVSTSIVRMPSNFPPSGKANTELSGMGTPDILGGYGTFSFYTSDAGAFVDRQLSGGKLYFVDPKADTVRGSLEGPENPFRVESRKLSTDFSVYIDPADPAVKIVVGKEERVLKEGEWSDWIPVSFEMIPTQSLRAICRFYLKSVRPAFSLYVTPLNIDPRNPAMPIARPASFASELADKTGLYYTQGMPEDTKALSSGVFTRQEFLRQAGLVGDEITRQYEYMLRRFQDGLLFYYFSSGDPVSHMTWRSADSGRVPSNEGAGSKSSDEVTNVYDRLDRVVGMTLENMDPDTTLVVMSDHGFTGWRRVFHLNTWLKENGFLAVKNPALRDDPGLFANVDFSRTRAYGLGLNGLYINLSGREKEGIVPPGERQALMDEIERGLLATVDPATGKPAASRVYQRERDYVDRGALGGGPDLVIGYARGTRCSNESALGAVPLLQILTNNEEPWSGDHCMDPAVVPGVLFTNRALKKPAPRLQDLPGAILAEFGIEGFPPRNQEARF